MKSKSDSSFKFSGSFINSNGQNAMLNCTESSISAKQIENNVEVSEDIKDLLNESNESKLHINNMNQHYTQSIQDLKEKPVQEDYQQKHMKLEKEDLKEKPVQEDYQQKHMKLEKEDQKEKPVQEDYQQKHMKLEKEDQKEKPVQEDYQQKHMKLAKEDQKEKPVQEDCHQKGEQTLSTILLTDLNNSFSQFINVQHGINVAIQNSLKRQEDLMAFGAQSVENQNSYMKEQKSFNETVFSWMRSHDTTNPSA